MNTHKVGILLRTSETLMNKPPQGLEMYCLVAKNSREEKWVEKFIDPDKILRYETDEPSSKYSMEKLMKKTNLLEVLKQNNINNLVISTAYSDYKDTWGKENNINLLYVDYEKQIKYENKLWINEFLIKNNIPSPKSLVYVYSKMKKDIPFKGKIVLQMAESIGNDGTLIMDSIDEIDKYIEDKVVEPDTEYLLREFIEGRTFSIDLFIGPNIVATSLARRQCFFKTKYFNFFNGIQFMPASTFSKTLKNNINTTFRKLADLLHKDNYLGYADFDFMVDKDDNIYILECNARYTTASPHLIHFDEIFSGIPTSTIFWYSFLNKTPYKETFAFHEYPESEYEGSVLRILSDPHSEEELLTVKHEYDIGVYELSKGNIMYKTPDVRKAQDNKKDFIYYCDIQKGQEYGPIRFVGELFSTFALYEENGNVNEKAKLLLNTFNIF